MKKCLKYMSEYWHWEYYIALVSAFVFLPIPRGNIFMVMALTYVINAMSLSMFGMDSGIIYRRDGRDKLTLSLPMSRKTIYDTRMYVMSSLYLACVLLSLIAYIPKGMYVSYLCTFSSLLFGHMMCGLCIRKPHCHSLSGIPAFIVSWLYIWENINENVETSMLLKVVMGNICVVMLAIDVYVWLHERRIFINGSSEGNVVKKENTDHDENIKTSFRVVKLKKVVLIAILAVIGYLLFPLFVTGIFVLGYKTAKVEVHNNVNDYLKYHSGPQAEEKYQNKWNMDETIWPEKITPDMTIEDYKMVYYNPLDAQFLGYLTVRYDKENYDKEVKRLKDYESTAYLGYYGVTGFEDYELLAMYADSYQGFVYALTDGKDKIIYVEIIFCNYFMDLDYEKYIPADYLPEGFDAKMNNPYQKKWEKENGLDDLQIF